MKFQVFERAEPIYPVPYRSSREVYEHFKDLGKMDREVFMVCLLNTKGYIVDSAVIAVGCADSAVVGMQEVFKGVVSTSAASIILVHNHPGSMEGVQPSVQDRRITQNIVTCAKLFGVKVCDHVIVGGAGWYSFADRGEMDIMESEARRVIDGIGRA